MLYNTRGIVLHQFKYSENSIIVKIYTEQLGLQSYIIKGARSKKSGVKANTIQPLALLDLVVYKKEKSSLHTIKELSNSNPQSSIPFDLHKSAIVLFLNEILYKCIKEEEPDGNLFGFIHNSLNILDLKTEHFANFHLFFLVKLTKYLGISPQNNYSPENVYFDLYEGLFKNNQPMHGHFMQKDCSTHMHRLMLLHFDKMDELQVSGQDRRTLLHKLIEYYELHITRLSDIKSHQILEAVIS